jgi:hypothetical protein
MGLNIRYNTVEAAFYEMSQEQECFLFFHVVTFLILPRENKQVLTCIISTEIYRKFYTCRGIYTVSY